MIQKKPIMLIILDGFGIREDKPYNGVLNAHMNNYFSFWNNYPHTKLNASGPLVGLPDKQIGSSEVGHMTLGAGQLIKQPIVRINEEIENNKFENHPYLKSSLIYLKRNKSNLHLMGLLGSGGVHSTDKHLFALLDFYDLHASKFAGKVYIHNFLDGRDTAQKSAEIFLEKLEKKINSLTNPSKFIISTLCGRYFAMDRDQRWDRTKKSYDLLTNHIGKRFETWRLAIKYFYKKNITDEFIEPTILNLKPISRKDICIFYNFRSDRPKQLVKSLLEKNFNEFETKKELNTLKFYTLTDYIIPNLKNINVLYKTIYPKNTFGEVISKSKLKQLRIAESEKFPHVTYFFSGLKDKEFIGETRIKIDSPKVATYDLKPEMSAKEVTKKVITEINKNEFDFILLNFANSDMVGHTGDYKAVISGLKEVDKHLLEIKTAIDKKNGILMITSDHGNCETMKDENNKPHTKHTYNLVPFILCNNDYKLRNDIENLSLYNIAPTILELMKIKKPKEMDKSLLKYSHTDK